MRGGDVNVINRDGSGLCRVTRTRGAESSPEWGPGARSIAYVRKAVLWIIDAEGRNERRVIGKVGGPIDWQQTVP